MNAAERTQWVTERAREAGFDLCGVAPASDFEELARLPEWLARGYGGEIRYLHDARRQSPAAAMPGARSIIVCALNYNTPHPYSTEAHVAATFRSPSSPASSTARTPAPRGWISRYAWGDDYHDVLGEKLQNLLAAMRGQFAIPFDARAYVDTGPVVERVAAKHAGLGWLGKNTCLINEHLGSWLFLGVILTTLELQPSLYDELGESAALRSVGTESPRSGVRGQMSDLRRPTSALRLEAASDSPLATRHLLPAPDLCGNCTQCIDACPTGAIVEPYVLDARRCISYLTIELRGPIPEEFRAAMGWHVFGCDICQDVCPFNRRAPVTDALEFQPRRVAQENGKGKIEKGKWKPQAGGFESSHAPLATSHLADSLLAPYLERLAAMTEDEFRRIFSGSAVKRTKWRGLVRNACIALGNCSGDLQVATGDPARVSARLEKLSRSADPVVADAARWALDRVQTATTKS